MMKTIVKLWSFWRFTYYGNCLIEYFGGFVGSEEGDMLCKR